MMHKAWHSIEEVPYVFFRSSIKLQDHTEKSTIWIQFQIIRLSVMGFMRSCWKGLCPSPPTKFASDSTQPLNTLKRKWQLPQDGSDEFKLPCRSQAHEFDIKIDCLYCGEDIDHQKELTAPRHRHRQSHDAATTELLSSVLRKAQ